MWQEHLYLAALTGTVCCLIFIVYFVIKNRTINSTSLSLFVWLVFSLLMLFIEPFIYSSTKNISLDRLIWYGSFATLDVLAILVINFLHKKNRIELSVQSLLLNLSFFIALLLQVSRYFDKQVFETNVLTEVYKEGITMLNILTWAFVICVVVISKAKKNKRLKNV
jgi:hypothetical protein